jgi:hypothetical protein
MGADKNSSRKMTSAYAPNSQPMILTRVRQGHVVTTDLPTLGTNPNSKQHGSTTQEAKDLSNLQWPGRTVRMEGADCPRGPGGPSASTGRTVRNWFPNLQYRTAKDRLSAATRGPSAMGGPSALSSRTVHRTSGNQNHRNKQIEKKRRKISRRTGQTPSSRAPRGPSATPWRTVRHTRTEQPELETTSTKTPICP